MATKSNFAILTRDLDVAVKMLAKDSARLNIELRIFFAFVYVGVKALVYLVKVLETKL